MLPCCLAFTLRLLHILATLLHTRCSYPPCPDHTYCHTLPLGHTPYHTHTARWPPHTLPTHTHHSPLTFPFPPSIPSPGLFPPAFYRYMPALPTRMVLFITGCWLCLCNLPVVNGGPCLIFWCAGLYGAWDGAGHPTAPVTPLQCPPGFPPVSMRWHVSAVPGMPPAGAARRAAATAALFWIMCTGRHRLPGIGQPALPHYHAHSPTAPTCQGLPPHSHHSDDITLPGNTGPTHTFLHLHFLHITTLTLTPCLVP